MILHGDLDLDPVQDNPDGYPIYDSVRMSSFVLTNSNQKPKTMVLSFGVEKMWDWADDSLFLRFGYAYTDAEGVQPMTSSVAFSNYMNRAFFDPQEDVVSKSNYQTTDRLTFVTRWEQQFRRNMGLQVALFGQYNSGRPYSYAYNGTADPYGFTPYLDNRDNVLEPGDARNGLTGSDWSKLDLKVTFDFPGFSDRQRGSVYLVIDNLTNLLNDEWGVLYQHNFPFAVAPGTLESRIGDASRYEILFGLNYKFE